MNMWTKEQEAWLKENYPIRGKMACCEYLGKLESQVRQKAAKMGLRLDRTAEHWKDFQSRAAHSKLGRKRPDQAAVMLRLWDTGKIKPPNKKQRKAMSQAMKKRIKALGHPKGMLGKNHSANLRKRFSEERTIHGGHGTREYGIWVGMKFRCLNPKCVIYHNYGGRGITVCNRWLDSYQNFIEDIGCFSLKQAQYRQNK